MALVGLAAVAGLSGAACPPDPHATTRSVLREFVRERAGGLDAGTREEVVRALLDAQSAHGVDALLLAAMAARESGFDPRARSRHGAVGLLQLRPDTARAVAGRHGISWSGDESLLDPETNAALGAAYLAELEARFGSRKLALAAYLRGPTSLRRVLAEGRPVRSRYADRVLRLYENLRARRASAGAKAS